MLGAMVGTALWWGLYLLVFRQDRRRVRNGVLLLLALFSSISLIGRLVSETIPLGALLVGAGALLAVLGVIALGVFLVLNGLTMVRKEGRSLGTALSGLAGLALLGAPVVSTALVLTLTPVGIGLGMLLGVIALHVGLAFLVFLGASVPYQLFPRQLQTTGIIVHGSGLIDGRVPPLLRSRLERGVTERERLLAAGIDPLLVPSGGRGEDEPRAEGEAMAEYLLQEAGVPEDRVRAETASRTTEENLIFSHRVLDEAGHQGPYVVSTSRYHAFRAALLARTLGYEDEAIGGRTTFYYVPSATLREFIAILSYRKIWLTVTFLPSLAFVGLIVRAALLTQ
ncbi:YdcF family protein [Brachybacterium sp. YJGR34]|uniref:YdcF family protein n=1 Tax=Brachybacterium sp. YJGR34 TaxID=2059911 RepID=UPI000E0C6B1A|nr:YdcF family protein [Brachybacterium sp. YJGR34]